MADFLSPEARETLQMILADWRRRMHWTPDRDNAYAPEFGECADAIESWLAAMPTAKRTDEDEMAVCKACRTPVQWHKIRLLYDCTNCGWIDGSAMLVSASRPSDPPDPTLWEAFEAGHQAWPTPEAPTRRKMFEAWLASATLPPAPQETSPLRALRDTQGFHSHLEVCTRCANHPMDLCAVGARLLHGSASLPPAAPPDTLHQQIMNIPCQLPYGLMPETISQAYKLGHRDARHAAAELVIAPPAAGLPPPRSEKETKNDDEDPKVSRE